MKEPHEDLDFLWYFHFPNKLFKILSMVIHHIEMHIFNLKLSIIS
jgi:hypothetical protein